MAMNDLQKRMAGVGVVAAVLVGSVLYFMFRPGTEAALPSTVTSVGDGVKPGTESVADAYYRRQLDLHNASQRELALSAGKTSVAILNPDEVAANEPAVVAESSVTQMPAAGAQQDSGPGYDEARYRLKLAMMKSIMDGDKAEAGRITLVAQEAKQQASAATVTSEANQSVKSEQPVLIAGGTTVAATLDAAVDTDVPGEVFATIRGGQFDGAKLVGSISRMGDYIRMPFTTMYFGNQTYQIAAVGMDPETGRAVLSGEVDSKFLERFGWPFLVAAVGGAGEAAARPETSVSVSSGGATEVSSTEATTKEILGKSIQAGAQSVAQGISADERPQKAVRRGADAIVIRFISEVKAKQG